MVVFTCNHCGDSLHKPSVEKHYNYACRKMKSLTCVDCLKDFRDEEYVVHTKCLTEDERYAAKGSIPNGIVKKGEVKQESWVDMIKSILDKEPNMKPSHRNLLSTISNYSNIPRKKPKFMNFIRSSSGGRVNMKDVEEIWNIIETYKNQIKNQLEKGQTKNENNIQNGSILNGSEKDKKNDENLKRKSSDDGTISKKKKKVETEPIPDLEINQEIVKFSFEDKILAVLSAKGNMSLKKLEKKVVNAYLKHNQESEITPKLIKKFNKKLKKIPNLEISDDRVILIRTED